MEKHIETKDGKTNSNNRVNKKPSKKSVMRKRRRRTVLVILLILFIAFIISELFDNFQYTFLWLKNSYVGLKRWLSS